MEMVLWIAGGIVVLNVVGMAVLYLIHVLDERRWKREHSGPGR